MPAWRFFKAFEDLRYLIDCDILPEYDIELLASVWDRLLIQYDQISGEHIFENIYADLDTDLEEWNEIIILRIHYGLLRVGHTERIHELKEFGIKAETFSLDLMQRLRSEIMKRYTRIELDQAIESENETKAFKQKSTYIQSVVQLSQILGRTLDHKTITTSEYIYLNKEAREVIKAKTPKSLWVA